MMHQVLDPVWDEIYRVLNKGGFCCINIGDATRTVGDRFALYPNHSRILSYLYRKGLTPLPAVLWRKQTNAPNKFMGSGMLPAGAYVTLEHEYILILRKVDKREFKSEEERLRRQQSAIFWEERNQWFSDVWMDLKGARQDLGNNHSRARSGAFPFELAYRLINMFSVQEDIVLDPFLGIGTTMLAAMTAGRNSVSYELREDFKELIVKQAESILDIANAVIRGRLAQHLEFVEKRIAGNKALKHINRHYGFPVITNQEKNLMIPDLKEIKKTGDLTFEIHYDDGPQAEFCAHGKMQATANKIEEKKSLDPKPGNAPIQRNLFEGV
jgi:DNA modification methylase